MRDVLKKQVPMSVVLIVVLCVLGQEQVLAQRVNLRNNNLRNNSGINHCHFPLVNINRGLINPNINRGLINPNINRGLNIPNINAGSGISSGSSYDDEAEQRAEEKRRLEEQRREISNFQRNLAVLGYYTGEVDGIMGPLTQKAVKDFQRNHGLQVNGVCESQTRQALAEVLAIQNILAKLQADKVRATTAKIVPR